MNRMEWPIEQDNDTIVSQMNTFPTSQSSKSTPLREHVRAAVREYFVRLDGAITGQPL